MRGFLQDCSEDSKDVQWAKYYQRASLEKQQNPEAAKNAMKTEPYYKRFLKGQADLEQLKEQNNE